MRARRATLSIDPTDAAHMLPANVPLNDDTTIPRLGLGVWRADDDEAEAAVAHALSVGYRHVDTAAIYGNERGVGRGLAAADVARDDVYITSKVWNDRIRANETAAAIDESLDKLGLDTLDLMLLHWPTEGRIAAWEALIEARDAGKVRSIGVSNFLPSHLDELIAATAVVPALNQIEHHPWLRQPAIVAACRQHRIAVEAWSPLLQGRMAESPEIGEIANELEASEAQVVLRWALQHDVIVIPKSVTPSRIEENARASDIELDDDQIQRLDALAREERLGPDPASFSF